MNVAPFETCRVRLIGTISMETSTGKVANVILAILGRKTRAMDLPLDIFPHLCKHRPGQY